MALGLAPKVNVHGSDEKTDHEAPKVVISVVQCVFPASGHVTVTTQATGDQLHASCM